MKTIVACLLTAAALSSAAFIGPIGRPDDVRVSLTLVKEPRRLPVPGVVRFRGADGSVIRPASLVSRGWGLDRAAAISEWCVVPGEVPVDLPAEKISIEAVSGIETDLAQVSVDLSKDGPRAIKIPIRQFSDLRKAGWFGANTHLHLSKLTREESDRYLLQVPAADRLDLLFISMLERADDDRGYITNEYPAGRQKQLESRGVHVSNGEEHRHNFGPQGEGFGHVMLLGIKEFVRPASIGFGISKQHPDAPPIRTGIDNAREQGGTAIWCHNNWGFEDVPNWLGGRLDAQNIFDGGSHGGYEDSFYRYLNAGLKVPFSTGTDWFMYDFSRCYARVDGELSPESWLAALRAGRTFITNGPLLKLSVNGSEPGATIELAKPSELRVEVTARGRLDFGQLELIKNGRVIESATAQTSAFGFSFNLNVRVNAEEPCWLAARTTTTAKNEYGQPLFAHTSAIYITVAGRTISRDEDVRFLLSQLESARSTIAAKARFDTDRQRDSVLQLYDQSAATLRSKLGND